MAADRWSVCPRCFHQAQKTAAAERAAVMATYGKVPVEEFDAARDALEEPDRDTYTTFREDFEFYDAETGTVEASYSGECTACGLSASLKASEQFWTVGDD